jgi:hypothetical protein
MCIVFTSLDKSEDTAKALRGRELYAEGVVSAENVISDQTTKHSQRFLSTARETFSVA